MTEPCTKRKIWIAVYKPNNLLSSESHRGEHCGLAIVGDEADGPATPELRYIAARP